LGSSEAQQFRTAVEFIPYSRRDSRHRICFWVGANLQPSPFLIVDSPALLIAGYTVLSIRYMYRSIDTGLRSIDVRTLTEAAQSLGAGWGTILSELSCQISVLPS